MLSIALAALQAPDFTLKALPSSSGELRIEAGAPPNHHFNLKSPAKLEWTDAKSRVQTTQPPSERKPMSVEFRIPGKATEHGKVQATLYLCDDATTFCERHTVASVWNGSSLKLVKATPNPTSAKSPPPSREWSEGFYVNDAQKALSEAKRKRQPLFIDFYGIWCPPCNQLEEVYSAPKFKQLSQGFVKLKLDSDAEASWELKSRYKVSAYPTIVFANADGEELLRLVGFTNEAPLYHALEITSKLSQKPLKEIQKGAKKGDPEDCALIANRKYFQKQYDEAIRFFDCASRALPLTDPRREESVEATIARARLKAEASPEARRDLVLALREANRQFPESDWSIERRSELAATLKEVGSAEERTAVLNDLVQVAQRRLKRGSPPSFDPSRPIGYDFPDEDIRYTLANALEELGRKEEAKLAYAENAKSFQRRIEAKGKKDQGNRGELLELAYSLWKSGKWGEAERIYRTQEERFPREFTFYFNHARMHSELINYGEARKLAEKALEFSYGDNRLRVTALLAKTLGELGQKSEALQLLQTEIKRVRLPSDTDIRTHRYYKTLVELQRTLSQTS